MGYSVLMGFQGLRKGEAMVLLKPCRRSPGPIQVPGMNGPNIMGVLAKNFQPPGPPWCSVHLCQGLVYGPDICETNVAVPSNTGAGARMQPSSG